MTLPKNSSPLPDRATAYAVGVVSGLIVAGPHVRNACKRHLADLRDGPARGLRWDVEAAARAIRYFATALWVDRTATDPADEHDGGLKPFVLLDWQAFIIGCVFGWMGPDGYRRFRVAFIEAGKGTGKSPLAAGVGLYMMTADNEPRAEIYAAARMKDQAKVLFRDAVAMVDRSEALSARLTLSGGTEKTNIAHIPTGSFFRPISSEDRGKGKSGPRPHCALLDEVHEHGAPAMVEFMRAGTKGRRQALIFMITNSGSDRDSVCWTHHEYGCKVAAGDLQDDSYFAYICALDPGDDPLHDESCWHKANPSLGLVIPWKYVREQVREALGMPSKQNLVLRLNFCVWTDADDAWIGHDQWMACERDLDLDKLRGKRCHVGLDLGALRDLTAGAFAFPAEGGSGVKAFVEFWSPGDTLAARADIDAVPYPMWEEQGHLFAPPGKTIDFRYVAMRIAELSGIYDIVSLTYDRWRIQDLFRALEEVGVDCYLASEGTGDGIALIEFGQGFKDMSPAVQDLESGILGGTLEVQANPVLRWNAASAVLMTDPAGNRKFAKNKATGRIDGVIALAMANRLAAQEVRDDGTAPFVMWA